MIYRCRYQSPLGAILLSADDEALRVLSFEDQMTYEKNTEDGIEKETPLILETKRWLDIYFEGRNPGFLPPLHIEGTDFQKTVWSMLLSIPYGGTVTYGELASRIASERGIKRMSSQAVGGAVGRNRVAIIVPCHRVIGKGGALTGYATGLWRKKRLLELEGIYDNK